MWLEIARANGWLKQYFAEFEYMFTQKFFIMGLDMALKRRFAERSDYMKKIARYQKKLFPNFQSNIYYQENVPKFNRDFYNFLVDIA